jgi:tRNA pseudouridine13 synthase
MLFNQLVSARIAHGSFSQPLNGDLFRLSGSRSFFTEAVSAEILQRLEQGDIQIAAPLPGSNKEKPNDSDEEALNEAGELAAQVFAPFADWIDGLQQQRLEPDSRPIALKAADLTVTAIEDNSFKLSFSLPVGCYATAIMRELADLTDVSRKVMVSKEGGQ